MLINIVICTHTRVHSLMETLAAVNACARPADSDIEVLVVANACTDDTVHRCRQADTNVIEVAELGLSRARNAGVAATRGEAILWLDDDVTPSPELLVTYCRALHEYPEAAFFGGPIRIALEGRPSRWAGAAVDVVPTVWAARDLGDEDRDLDVLEKGEHPFGANMVTRRSAVADGFRESLGRRGDRCLIGGEESDLFQRVAAAGGHGRWVACASVEHRIGPERQTLRYVAHYFQDNAYGVALNGRARRTLGWLGAVRADLRVGLEVLRLGALRALRPPRYWLPAYASYHRALGQRRAIRHMSARNGGQVHDVDD